MGRPTQHAFSPFVGGRAIRVRYAIPEPHTPLSSGRGVAARDRVAAVIAAGTRPDFPFRTRKLRLPAPMVLHPPGCGRVGHRRQTTTRGGPPSGPPSCLPPHARGCPRTHGTTDNHPPPPTRPSAGRQPPHRPTRRQPPTLRQTPPPPRRQPTHRQTPTPPTLRPPACSA